METMPRPVRFTDDDLALIKWLAHAWGPVKPMDRTAVIREALKRAKQAEERKNRNKGKAIEIDVPSSLPPLDPT